MVTMGFPGGSDSKESACNAGDSRDWNLISWLTSSGVGDCNPLWYILPRKFHGQRSLVGYSLWDRKESDVMEQTHTHNGQIHKCCEKLQNENK